MATDHEDEILTLALGFFNKSDETGRVDALPCRIEKNFPCSCMSCKEIEPLRDNLAHLAISVT